MCYAEKCCYIFPVNVGCIVIGVCSFILSSILIVFSIVVYVLESRAEEEIAFTSHHYFKVVKILGFELNVFLAHVVLSIMIIVATLWMVASVLLILGILKNKPSLVLCYFLFGIIVTILIVLTALLTLIQNGWRVSIAIFIFTKFHIHCLVVVHTVYEQMQTGKDFRFQRQNDDEDQLVPNDMITVDDH